MKTEQNWTKIVKGQKSKKTRWKPLPPYQTTTIPYTNRKYITQLYTPHKTTVENKPNSPVDPFVAIIVERTEKTNVDSKGVDPVKKSARKINEGPNATFPHCPEDAVESKVIVLVLGEHLPARGIKIDNKRHAC